MNKLGVNQNKINGNVPSLAQSIMKKEQNSLFKGQDRPRWMKR